MRHILLITCFSVFLTACAGNGQPTSSSYIPTSGPMGESVRDVYGFGLVTHISENEHTVIIKHAPIPEMNWPPMLMSFNVVSSIDLKPFKQGDKVQFVLEVDKEDDYRIKSISAKQN